MKQRTCILVKPDGVEKNLIGKILDRFESEGLKLIALKMIPPTKSLMETFYAEHRGKPFYGPFMEFMMSGPIIATVWEGNDIIARSRSLIGATNSSEAGEGTLRNLYGTDNRKNLVHGSDSLASSEREINVLFDASEICGNAVTELKVF